MTVSPYDLSDHDLYLACLEDWARWYVEGVWTYEEFVGHADAMLGTVNRPTRSEQSLEGAAVNGLTPVGEKGSSE